MGEVYEIRKLWRWMIPLPLLAMPIAATSTPRVSLDLGLHYEDNLTRGDREIDRIGDTAIELNAHATRTLAGTERAELIGELGVSTQWWFDTVALSRLAGDAGLRYRLHLGDGRAAPWLEVGLNGSVLRFKDSPIRDGAQGRLGFTLGQHLGERLDGRVGYAWQIRRAEEDTVFDLATHEVFGQLDYALSDRWLVYGGLTARHGDLVTVARIPNFRALAHASAVSRDLESAFGPAPRRTYRIDGSTLEGELGFNLLLGPGLALDLAASGLVAAADGGNQYDNTSVTLSVLWQFD